MKSSSIKSIAGPMLALALPILGFAASPCAQPPATQRSVVLELFTSQGCSSCPPADALLGELANQPNVIALAFHVDYWDSIGWSDRFAVPEAVKRQRQYVEVLGLSSAFTPQAVIDGRRSLVGSDRQGIQQAIADAPALIPIQLAVSGGELTVSLPSVSDHRVDDVNVVAYLPQATTQIGHGENAGRKLTEFNIVRQFRRLGTWDGKSATFQVPLNSFPSDANRVAVLIQQGSQGPIEGASIALLQSTKDCNGERPPIEWNWRAFSSPPSASPNKISGHLPRSIFFQKRSNGLDCAVLMLEMRIVLNDDVFAVGNSWERPRVPG